MDTDDKTGLEGKDDALPETFDFQHKLFRSTEDGCFRRSSDGNKIPVFVLTLGESEYSLPFDGILQEFQIDEEAADARMLELVEEALHYQRRIRPGDPIPPEMLTGAASWDVTEEHRVIAQQRINVQLAYWLAGDGTLITDPDQLQQIAEDPTTRARVNEALERAAKELDFGDDGKDKVLDMLETLAEDLAGVEALRDYLDRIRMICRKADGLTAAFKDEMGMLEIAMPVAQLSRRALNEFEEDFELLDAQTGEIIAVLRNLDAQTRFIRDTRDGLYERLMDWEEMFEKFGPTRVASSIETGNLLREAYRFLAPRYMQVDQWDLNTKLADKSSAA